MSTSQFPIKKRLSIFLVAAIFFLAYKIICHSSLSLAKFLDHNFYFLIPTSSFLGSLFAPILTNIFPSISLLRRCQIFSVFSVHTDKANDECRSLAISCIPLLFSLIFLYLLLYCWYFLPLAPQNLWIVYSSTLLPDFFRYFFNDSASRFHIGEYWQLLKTCYCIKIGGMIGYE